MKADREAEEIDNPYAAPGGESGFVVVDSISLTVNEGQFVSIVGPSGCGKSTLLNIIAGIETCDEGSVTVSPRTGRARSEPRVAYVFQSPRLLNWLTVADNIRFVLDAQNIGPAGMLCRQVVVEAGARRADVERAGRAGRHPHPHRSIHAPILSATPRRSSSLQESVLTSAPPHMG